MLDDKEMMTILFNTGSKYFTLENEAKLLYMLLKNRTNIYLQHGWFDNDGRIYFYLQYEILGELLQCTNDRIDRLFNQLYDYELITNADDKYYLLLPEIK